MSRVYLSQHTHSPSPSKSPFPEKKEKGKHPPQPNLYRLDLGEDDLLRGRGRWKSELDKVGGKVEVAGPRPGDSGEACDDACWKWLLKLSFRVSFSSFFLLFSSVSQKRGRSALLYKRLLISLQTKKFAAFPNSSQ